MISQKILDALADNNWKPYIDTDDNFIDLEWYSPAGEDFLLSFNVKDDDDFLSQLFDAYMNFDTESARLSKTTVCAVLPACVSCWMMQRPLKVRSNAFGANSAK